MIVVAAKLVSIVNVDLNALRKIIVLKDKYVKMVLVFLAVNQITIAESTKLA